MAPFRHDMMVLVECEHAFGWKPPAYFSMSRHFHFPRFSTMDSCSKLTSILREQVTPSSVSVTDRLLDLRINSPPCNPYPNLHFQQFFECLTQNHVLELETQGDYFTNCFQPLGKHQIALLLKWQLKKRGFSEFTRIPVLECNLDPSPCWARAMHRTGTWTHLICDTWRWHSGMWSGCLCRRISWVVF